MVNINEDTWKEYRYEEAKKLFPLNDLIMYSLGTSKSVFGRVNKIMPSGTVYMRFGKLNPSFIDDVGGDFIEKEYTPKNFVQQPKIFLGESYATLPFYARFIEGNICWKSAKKSLAQGNSLEQVILDDNGFFRTREYS